MHDLAGTGTGALPLAQLVSCSPSLSLHMLRQAWEVRDALVPDAFLGQVARQGVGEQAPEAMQLRPWTQTRLDAGSETVRVGEVSCRDPESFDGELPQLILAPRSERIGHERRDPEQRREQLVEVALTHRALVARAAGTSSVMTWTYAPTSLAASPANSSTVR